MHFLALLYPLFFHRFFAHFRGVGIARSFMYTEGENHLSMPVNFILRHNLFVSWLQIISTVEKTEL
jgi:hypothetical protein